MADDVGFQPITQQPSDDVGFQPMPKIPDISGIQKTAQDNLADNNDKETDSAPKIQTPSQRMDTALGVPVSSLLKSDNNTPMPAPLRRQLTKSYADGSATDGGDFMQTAIRAIAPVAHGISSYAGEVGENLTGMFKGGAGLIAYAGASPEARQDLLESGIFGPPLSDYKNPENPTTSERVNRALELERATAGTAMGALYAPVAAPIAPIINPAIEATPKLAEKAGLSNEWAQMIPKGIGAAMDIAGAGGIIHGGRGIISRSTESAPHASHWDNVPNIDTIKQEVGKAVGKPPEAVTPTDIDSAIADGAKNKLPAPQDFKNVETVTNGDIKESTLHIIYNDTGIKPDQVFADAQSSPEIAQEVSAGKIPQSYEHLVEPREVKPEKLIVARDEATKSFSVTDVDGDHVQGGFDSYEEAKHFIEDKHFEAEERTAIQAEEAVKPKTTTEQTAAGEQSVIPGAEKISDKDLAERKMEGAKQSAAPQKPANEGLFDVGARGQSDLFNRKPSVIPPAEIGKPTSLRTFLSNNGAKFNENNELVSIKKNGERVSGEAALEHANEIAKEHGYLPEDSATEPSKTFRELQNLLTEKNGGREAWRSQDADRVTKAEENKRSRERADPAYIEYQANNIGLDTERLKGETDKQFIDRLLKGLNDFYKNERGSGAYLRKIIGDTIIAAEKFVGKLTGNMFEKIADGYIRTFQPELVGPLAKRVDAFLAKFKAAGQEAENSYYRQSAASKAEFDRLTPDERMEWLYDHETGRWNAEEDPDHARFQAMYDAMHKAEQEAIGQETGYKENYLPHQWEKPDAVKAFFRSEAMIKKYGADWFKKASEFRLIQEGVRAGFKLKTDNPESMLVARQLASDNMIRTMNLLKDMESSGIAKKATAFGIDKKIAKIEEKIAEKQTKYKEEFEKKNPSAQTRAENLPPAKSKYMLALEKTINANIERLEQFKAEKAENKLTPEQMKALKTGFRVIGPDSKAWYIHQEVGPLWKNAMEMKGLWENQGVLGDSYRGYIQGKAQWVKTKLALSFFHPFHEVDIHVASRLATAAEHLIKGGKISDLSLADTGRGMGLTRNTLELKDHPQIVAWNTPDAMRTPEQKAAVQRMVEGGMNPIMSARDTVHFRENWNKAISGIGLNNLRLLTAALELPGKALSPLFEHWIPGLKVDSYFRQTELALKRDPSLANDAGRRGEVFRKISQDIDRNYGEMNSDTQFWNKTVRDTFNAAFISGGWKLAMLQNARGLLEPAKLIYNFAKTGEFSKEAITHQMLQSYFYTAIVLAQGAALTYLFTGTAGNIKDWIFPNTGDKNPDGSPIRLTQPAFLKEYLMLGRDINEMGDVPGIGHFLYHQTLIPGIVDTLNKRDYLGRPLIPDPTDLNQWASAGWDFIKPITVSGIEKAQAKQSEVAQNMNLAGFPLAGAWVNQTPFEQKVLHTYSEQNPPKDSAYEAKLKADLKSAVANNKSAKVEEIKNNMRKEGMTEHQISNAQHAFTKPFVDVAWSKLSRQDQERLLKSASDEEKAKFKLKSQ